jgi:hypothetical protein
MSGTLGASVENLTLRDYDRAERLLDRQYAANLSRYQTVAAELDEEETAATYEQLGDTQRAVIEDARAADTAWLRLSSRRASRRDRASLPLRSAASYCRPSRSAARASSITARWVSPNCS